MHFSSKGSKNSRISNSSARDQRGVQENAEKGKKDGAGKISRWINVVTSPTSRMANRVQPDLMITNHMTQQGKPCSRSTWTGLEVAAWLVGPEWAWVLVW